jgi:hypothetical protein
MSRHSAAAPLKIDEHRLFRWSRSAAPISAWTNRPIGAAITNRWLKRPVTNLAAAGDRNHRYSIARDFVRFILQLNTLRPQPLSGKLNRLTAIWGPGDLRAGAFGTDYENRAVLHAD